LEIEAAGSCQERKQGSSSVVTSHRQLQRQRAGRSDAYCERIHPAVVQLHNEFESVGTNRRKLGVPFAYADRGREWGWMRRVAQGCWPLSNLAPCLGHAISNTERGAMDRRAARVVHGYLQVARGILNEILKRRGLTFDERYRNAAPSVERRSVLLRAALELIRFRLADQVLIDVIGAGRQTPQRESVLAIPLR